MTPPPSELILLTLPRSKQLRPLIPLILDQLPHASLRLAVSRENYDQKAAELLASLPRPARVETVPCDLTSFADVQRAVAGASVVVHNGPPFHALETAIGQAVVAASTAAGTVKHVIYCSVIHPLRTKMTNHAAKLGVEERLVESGLGYTILRPTHVMQNLPLQAVLETRTIAVPYAGDILHGFVDLNDERDVILAVLKDLEKHNRATYELVGCNGTYQDVARAFETMSLTRIREVLASIPSTTVVGNPPRVETLEGRDSGFLRDSAARIPFIVCMVILGLVVIGVLIWLICVFFIGGAAMSRRRRVRARFYSGPKTAPTTEALPNLPSPKPAVHGQPGPVSAMYAPPAGFPVDHGPAYAFARG